jgi:hypothetical protein
VTLALRALTEHRDDLVKARTQTVNRLHVLLAHLVPGGAPTELTATVAAGLLRQVRPRDVLGADVSQAERRAILDRTRGDGVPAEGAAGADASVVARQRRTAPG